MKGLDIIQSILVLKTIHTSLPEGVNNIAIMWNTWTRSLIAKIVLLAFINLNDGFMIHSSMMPYQLENYELDKMGQPDK